MFGMDLNHGTDDNRPYPYPRPAAANTDFVPVWEQLLREVWVGVENAANISGARPTDEASIESLARRLDDMLSVRRADGHLSRDELLNVSMMSWFHLTLDFNSSIVEDMEAYANSPEERLMKIGARVGLPAHSRSAEYFRLAENMSLILREIEAERFNTIGGAETLYTVGTANDRTILDPMLANIRDWSAATGRDMKARQVSVAAQQPRAIRSPMAFPSQRSNGQAPVNREALPT
jgi:hypothetical protein